MLVSVILPVHNAEKTIRLSIESILNQTHQEFEILTIVNGCTDGTEDSIREIKDSRIKVLYSEKGIVPALNKGIRESSGELLARQDADDIWFKEKLQKQLGYLKDNPEIDILGCQMSIVDGSYNHIRDTKYPLKHEQIVNNLLNAENSIGHPSVIFKKKILDKCAGYLDTFPFAEDMDLWIRSAAWYKMANLPEILVRYTHIPGPNYDPRVPMFLSSWYRNLYGVKND